MDAALSFQMTEELMKCEICDNPAGPGDDYCTDCRGAIDGFRRAISGAGDCIGCGRAVLIDGLCRCCFDEISTAIVAADGTLPPSERGGGSW
jgi:hypothetical protein